MYKPKISQNPDFMNDIFEFHEPLYPLRNQSFVTKKPIIVTCGKETISYRYIQTWNITPTKITNVNSPKILKRQIKQVRIPCACKLCTHYVSNLGYIT